jgi:hypothetical protein
VHQVDPAGDRLDPVGRVGEVDAGRVGVAGIQAEAQVRVLVAGPAVTCPPCTIRPLAPTEAAALRCWPSSFLLGILIRLLLVATLITYGA